MTQEEKQDAFLNAYLPIRAKLERYVRSMTYDTEQARDTISETVLQAYEGFENLQSPEALLSYVFTIARRTLFRQRRRARIFVVGEDPAMTLAETDEAAPDSIAEARIVQDALHRLARNEREALILHELSDLSLIEVAVLQNVTLSAIKQRVCRARRKLARLLSEVSRETVVGLGHVPCKIPGLQQGRIVE